MKLLGHSIADLVKMIRHAQGRVNCTGLSGAEEAYLLYRLYAEIKSPLFVLCAKTKDAERLTRDICFFSGKTNIPIITFPSYDILPFKPLSYCRLRHPDAPRARGHGSTGRRALYQKDRQKALHQPEDR